jgi:hypothetical protein
MASVSAHGRGVNIGRCDDLGPSAISSRHEEGRLHLARGLIREYLTA